MKNYLFLLLLIIVLSSCQKAKKKQVLIIGDSISIGYTPFVEQNLADVADVYHNPGNAENTATGLAHINEWLDILPEDQSDWDIIQFNWGLWDLCFRHPDSELYGHRDKVNGSRDVDPDQYRKNLDSLIHIMKDKSDATLIFVTTSYVPTEEGGRFSEDAPMYNTIAKSVMAKNNIIVNDIYEQSKDIHSRYGKGEDDVHYENEGNEELGKVISEFLLPYLK